MLDQTIMIIRQCRCIIIKRNLVNKFRFLLFINFKIVKIFKIMLINFVFSNNNRNSVFKTIISIKISIKNFIIKTIAIRHSKINNVNRRRQTSLINNETRSIFNHCNRIVILLSSTNIVFINLIFNRIINRLLIATFSINNSEFIITKKTIKRIITKKNIKIIKKKHDDEKQNNKKTYQNENESNKSNVFINFFEKTRNYFVNTFNKQMRNYTCRRYATKFYFNNKFHKYVKSCNESLFKSVATKTINIF